MLVGLGLLLAQSVAQTTSTLITLTLTSLGMQTNTPNQSGKATQNDNPKRNPARPATALVLDCMLCSSPVVTDKCLCVFSGDCVGWRVFLDWNLWLSLCGRISY